MEQEKKPKTSYNPDLDKTIEEKQIDLGEYSVIQLSLRSYNDGPIKLQISRIKKGREGKLSFAKLGRLTKEEAIKVYPIFAEMVSRME